MSDLVIEPDTRVGALLDARPEAEEVLVGMAPEFKALKNPVLRRTVAKVATLEQAAKVAGVPARDLVLELRRALGVAGGNEVAEGGEGESDDAPPWVDSEAEATIDGGALLAGGETPIARAFSALAGMQPGEVLVLSAPFHPAPLIDSLRGKGHAVYARGEEGGGWTVWVRRH